MRSRGNNEGMLDLELVAGALPESVPGMIASLSITLVSLLSTLRLPHLSVGAAASLVISIVVVAVAAEAPWRASWGRQELVKGRV